MRPLGPPVCQQGDTANVTVVTFAVRRDDARSSTVTAGPASVAPASSLPGKQDRVRQLREDRLPRAIPAG